MINFERNIFEVIEDYYALRDLRYVVEITGDIEKALKVMEQSDEDFSPGSMKNVYHLNGIIMRKLERAGIAYRVLRRAA